LAVYGRYGITAKDMREAEIRLREAKTPFTIQSYENGIYRFADDTWERFWKAKTEIVTKSIEKLCRWFRMEGYKVGLDIFAPFLGSFTGQNAEMLSGCCDWLKPMMYRDTYAPAGIPYEISALYRETYSQQIESWFVKLVGDGRKSPDSDFLRRDLEWIFARAACPVYPGIEVNRVPQVANITPIEVWKAAEMLPDCTRTVVLSWNILKAPEENLAAAARMIQAI